MIADVEDGTEKTFKRDIHRDAPGAVVNVVVGSSAVAGETDDPGNDWVRMMWESPRRLVWKEDIKLCVATDDYVLVTGPPGIGKTFLMDQEFLAKAQVGINMACWRCVEVCAG
jgi:hypothetical protein